MIRSDIDVRKARTQLQDSGRVQIARFLQDDAADAIHHCLDTQVPWTLALCDASGMHTLPREQYAALDDGQRSTLFRELAASALGGQYRFAYDSYMMPRAYLEGRDPGLLLHRVLEFLNSPEVLQFMRMLTGAPQIMRIDAQATRYQAGQFLRTHNDEHSGEGRLFAYVINLTRRWQADWGGLLQFVDDGGAVFDTFMPHWNSLSLFRVPVKHTVSTVNAWAEVPRYAITGWLLSSARPPAAAG